MVKAISFSSGGQEAPETERAKLRIVDRNRASGSMGNGSEYSGPLQKILRNVQNRKPESIMAIGSVSTQAINRLRTVPHCKPE